MSDSAFRSISSIRTPVSFLEKGVPSEWGVDPDEESNVLDGICGKIQGKCYKLIWTSLALPFCPDCGDRIVTEEHKRLGERGSPGDEGPYQNRWFITRNRARDARSGAIALFICWDWNVAADNPFDLPARFRVQLYLSKTEEILEKMLLPDREAKAWKDWWSEAEFLELLWYIVYRHLCGRHALKSDWQEWRKQALKSVAFREDLEPEFRTRILAEWGEE